MSNSRVFTRLLSQPQRSFTTKAARLIPPHKIAEIGARKLAAMYRIENPLFGIIEAMAETASGTGRAAILHGAIRFPEGDEYSQGAEVMAGWGLEMQNTYNLAGLNVAGSAAAPRHPENESFRMFMSMTRYRFALRNQPELLNEVEKMVSMRPGIDEELLYLSRKSRRDAGLTENDAERQTDLVASWLKRDTEAPVPYELRNKLLENGSDVLADVILLKTYLNHLTPQIDVGNNLSPIGKNIFDLRADIQEFFDLTNQDACFQGSGLLAERYLRKYLGNDRFENLGVSGEDFVSWAKLREQIEIEAAAARGEDLEAREFEGLRMIGVQGPRKSIADPQSPAYYLWQVSNKGVPFDVKLEKENGEIFSGIQMGPFVEIEQRGLYLTANGEKLFSEAGKIPNDFQELEKRKLAHFTYAISDNWQEYVNAGQEADFRDLVENGAIELIPYKYPAFLGRSAQGIFTGNLTTISEDKENIAQTNEDAAEALRNVLGYTPLSTDNIAEQEVLKSKQVIINKFKDLGVKVNTSFADRAQESNSIAQNRR